MLSPSVFFRSAGFANAKVANLANVGNDLIIALIRPALFRTFPHFSALFRTFPLTAGSVFLICYVPIFSRISRISISTSPRFIFSD